MKSLGDRMKEYERVPRINLIRRTPVIIRLDGKAFHTLTRGCIRPFDQDFMQSMVDAACETAKEIQGFKLAYVQSDEVSFLLTSWDRLETEPWFGNNLQKIVSISAAKMSVEFNQQWNKPSLAVFDGRAFNIPTEEISNYFLWRAKDWERNSLQMYCQAFFSHKQLHKKNKDLMHEMLHEIGKNWATDLSAMEKNGSWLYWKSTHASEFCCDSNELVRIHDIIPTFDAINGVVEACLAKSFS